MYTIFVIFCRTALTRDLIPQTLIMMLVYLLTNFQMTSVVHHKMSNTYLKVKPTVSF